MKKRIILLISVVIFSGCWDKTELNDRAYVNSIAIDKAENSKNAEGAKKDKTAGEASFLTSIAISSLTPFEGNENGGKEEAENKSVKKSVGQTVSAAIRHSEGFSSRKLFFGHTKAIIFGERLLKDKKLFMEALDALERDKELSRKTLVLATEGDASEVITAQPEGEPSIGVFTDNFFKVNQNGTSSPITLEELLIKLRTGESVLIPKIKKEDEEAVIGGSAVIDGLTLRGYIDEQETRGILWQKKIKDACVIVEHNGIAVPFTVSRHRAETRLREVEGRLVSVTQISVEGSIDEYFFGKSINEQMVKEIEVLAAKEIKEEVKKANTKAKKDLGVDITDISGQLRKKEYSLWEKYGEKAFENAELRTNVLAKIKSVGLIN